jgi:YVTN family beta-propeller protein
VQDISRLKQFIALAVGIAVIPALIPLTGCQPAVQSVPSAQSVIVPFDPPALLRRPVALALVDSGARLLVANSKSGSVSVVDTGTQKVISEAVVGKGVADLVLVPGTDILLVADDQANELLAVRRSRGSLQTVGRVAVDASPVSVVVSSAGDKAFVACTWARRITVVDIGVPTRLQVESTIDLPFSPRLQQLLPDGRQLVALDAFGGRVGLIDVERQQLVKTHVLKLAHNLRGLTLAPDNRSILIPHQILMNDSATTQFGVHWGTVLMNILRIESVDSLFADREHLDRTRIYLGDQDDAAGDPTDVVVTRGGQRIVAFAGTSEVAISDAGGDEFSRVTVGRRPTALALSPDHQALYVANTFDDSITVVDIDSATVLSEISLGPQTELTLADQGELLFHDAHLSSDGWFSCHSCHTDGHSNGLLNDNFGDGSEGSPKRVLSLLGVAETQPWAWNGQREELAAQVRSSILTTMRGPEPTDEQIDSLIAYLQTLQPPPSLAQSRGELDATATTHGAEVFRHSGCVDCHPAPHYTSADVYDVGVHDSQGNLEFNPPSLRGVSQRDRLLHDNRATDLAELFREHRHGLDGPLGEGELDSLVTFLEGL